MDSVIDFLTPYRDILQVFVAILSVIFVSTFVSRTIGDFTKEGAASQFRSYRIALLGPPQSGKTTSLLACLDQIGRLRQPGVVRLRGQNTIVRVENARQQLNRGHFPTATKEEDSIVYRFDFKRASSRLQEFVYSLYSLPYLFRVEVADFAGEHTEKFFDRQSAPPSELPEQYSIAADLNFLKWVAEADQCVIYIDCDRINDDPSYAGSITAKYMSFWDRYLELRSDDMRHRSGPPLTIVFSKLDVILKTGNSARYNDQMSKLVEQFKDLLDYFDRQSRYVVVVGISVVLSAPDGERLGIDELCRSLLPNRVRVRRRRSETDYLAMKYSLETRSSKTA